MVWAKVALAGGLLLLFSGFVVGTEIERSASVMSQSYDCGAPIAASWLVSGTPNHTLNPGEGATAVELRAAAACSSVIHQSRVMILSTMGVGGLLAIFGWTVIGVRRESKPRQLTPARAQ